MPVVELQIDAAENDNCAGNVYFQSCFNGIFAISNTAVAIDAHYQSCANMKTTMINWLQMSNNFFFLLGATNAMMYNLQFPPTVILYYTIFHVHITQIPPLRF